MKCPNCGFENSGNFCTMCGTKITDSSPTAANTEFADNGQLYQNPYQNRTNSPQPPFHEVNQAPPTMNIANNQMPKTQAPHIPNATVPPIPNATAPSPQFSNGYGQSGSPYQPPATVQKPKNKNKVMPILITAFVIVVVLIGIGISIYSSLTNNKSIVDNFTSKLISDNDYDSYDYDDAYNDYDPYAYSVDEEAVLSHTDVGLVDCKISKLNDTDKSLIESPAGCKKVDLVFEITNTAHYDYIFDIYQFTVFDKKDFYDCEIFAINGKSTDDFKLTIKPDTTEQITLSCAVTKDCDSLEITYDDSGVVSAPSDSNDVGNKNNETIISCTFFAELADFDDPFLD